MYYIPLTQVCDFQGGSQPPKEQWIDHAEDGYIRMLQIRDFTQPDKDNIEYVRITKTVKTCNEDDILIGRYGASVGKILTGLSGAYNVAIIKTIPDESKLTKRFLYHYLNSPYFQSFIISVGSRAAQAGFNKEDLSDAHIPQLSLMEQEHAATQLDKIVYLISLRKQQLAKLDELVKSRFIELFGDPVKNNMGWESKPLNDVCDGIGDGLHGTPEYDEGGEYPFINGNNLLDGEIIITPATKMVAAKTFEKHFIDISTNAILISINGTLGKLAFYNGEKVMLGKSACYCNLKQDINKVFVYGVMKSDAFAEFLENSSTKSTIKNVGLKAMREFRLILPPMELQEQFAAFVEQVDKSKFEIQKSLEKLETLKKALMQKYFG